MIFGFGKSSREEEFEEEVELVLFQGTFSGVEVDISEHAKLVQAGLLRGKEIVTDALERRCEKFRIEPKGERSIIQLFVDGIGFAGGRISNREGLAVTQVLKLVAGMDIKNRKSPQQGGIRAEFDDRKYLVMLETKPMGGGAERLTAKLIDVKSAKYSPSELGYPEHIIEKIRELTDGPGVTLAAGPPDSELMDFAFTLVRGIDAYVKGTFSFVDVGHRDLGSLSQFDRRDEESLEEALQRLIRMEADIAFIEPFDDQEVVKQALSKTSEIAVVSRITAKDAGHGIEQFYKQAGDPQLVAEHLRGIFGRKMIRKLCDKCKQPYRPNPKLIKKVGLPEEVQTLYRKPEEEEGVEMRICKACGGSGYLGQTAMVELIEVSEGIKPLIAAGRDSSTIKAKAREEGMPTFKNEGLRLVAEGVTSLEELQRVFRSA